LAEVKTEKKSKERKKGGKNKDKKYINKRQSPQVTQRKAKGSPALKHVNN